MRVDTGIPAGIPVRASNYTRSFIDCSYAQLSDRLANNGGIAYTNISQWYEQNVESPTGTKGVIFRGMKKTTYRLKESAFSIESPLVIFSLFSAPKSMHEAFTDSLTDSLHRAILERNCK